MNLYFIIVIYNSRIEESITINNLLSLRKPNYILMIIDNSINGVNNDNKEFADKNELLYFTKNENMGLSKATNFAITKLNTMGLNDYDIVTPLNDDTQITLEYLSLLEENALKFEEYDIFAPILQGQNGKYYSPAKQGYFKNYGLKKMTEVIPQNKFYAIYSCCSCRWEILKNYQFDEDIFMDYIDHNFCYDQRKKGRKFKILAVVLQQNYALQNKNIPSEKMMSRLKIQIPDWLAFCKNKKIRLIGYIPYWIIRGFVYSKRSNDITVLFWTIKTALKCLFGFDRSKL